MNGSGAEVEQTSAIADRAAPMVDRLTLTNGVILKIIPVPPLAMREVSIQVKPPVVPVVFIQDKGREEANPNDPDYIAAVIEHNMKQIEMLTNILLALGTKPIEIPEGVFKPEDEGWLEQLEFLGIKIDTKNRLQRYLSWLRYYALASGNDISNVVRTIMQFSGTTEEEVAAVVHSFRRSA